MFVWVLITTSFKIIRHTLVCHRCGAENIKLPIYNVKQHRQQNQLRLTVCVKQQHRQADFDALARSRSEGCFFVTGEFADKYADDIKKLSGAGHEISNRRQASAYQSIYERKRPDSRYEGLSRKIKMITGNAPRYRAPMGNMTTKAGITFPRWNERHSVEQGQHELR